MAMFKKQIRFTGKHAEIMQKYCKDKGGDQEIKFTVSNNSGLNKDIYIFENRIDIYLIGGMIGVLEKRKAEIDRSTSTYATIMVEIIDKYRNHLNRLYQHMILAEDSELDPDTRIKKAFKVQMSDEESEIEQKNLEDYVRGGLEIIDEIFCECKTYEDICNCMFELTERYQLSNNDD